MNQPRSETKKREQATLGYLKRKQHYKNPHNRPVKHTYLHIAKATKQTYQQARTAIQKLEKKGKIKIYKTWEHTKKLGYKRANYYMIIGNKKLIKKTIIHTQ